MISMDVMCVHNKKAEPERYCAYCEVDRLTQTVQLVRKLHKPEKNIVTINGSKEACVTCYVNYPCPTIKALDGEQ